MPKASETLKPELVVIGTDLADTIKTLQDVRREKAILDKAEKAILTSLKPLVDPMFDSGKCPASDSLVLIRSDGVTRTIVADLLLERGVDPGIISFATKTTSYYKYQVKDRKEA